jgi:hypothetical protein
LDTNRCTTQVRSRIWLKLVWRPSQLKKAIERPFSSAPRFLLAQTNEQVAVATTQKNSQDRQGR